MTKFNDLKNAPNKVAGNLMLYVVHFYEEDFYKIGATSKRLEVRFRNYPKFEIIQTWDTPIANSIVRQVVLSFRNYTPYNWKYNRPGRKECFRTNNVNKIIDFIRQRLEGGNTRFYICELLDGTYQSSIRQPLGIIKFEREVPIHKAIELLHVTKQVSSLMDSVAIVVKVIKK